MFRVLNKDNAQNKMVIQGAFSHNSNVDICRILFQNYDSDTSKIYDMAEIGMQDQWASSALNGFGNLIFRTNADGSSNLIERMRIQYDGKIGLGTAHPRYALDVIGDVAASSNLYIGNMNLAASNGKLGIGTANPNEVFEIRNGDVLSKNLIKKTSCSNLNLHWNDASQFIFETIQHINTETLKGTRTQTHTLDSGSLSLSSEFTKGTGNVDAYTSLSLLFDFQSSNMLQILSYSSLSNLAPTAMQLTVNILSTTVNAWLS
jgi:hypothetical protein